MTDHWGSHKNAECKLDWLVYNLLAVASDSPDFGFSVAANHFDASHPTECILFGLL